MSADIGWLEVYVKPEGNNGTRGLKPGFTVNVNMGEDWFNHTIPVPKMTEPFQVSGY
ncbi:hypothetical protein DPMN_007877 [Dreissena polymorpha]|uniref:Uncharacterized protein n=1 Tax=Dreissena polymorpha TaxID=45954 RepID=A0A9D4MY58_DREPO|nr:hypothetical protein DPMN_007877 [Dreissena polymorpha]